MANRILVVDDSVVVRRVVADFLVNEGPFDVFTSPNGRLCMERLETTAIDLVILDVEMPERNGIHALREIQRRWPRLPVMVSSALTEPAGVLTLDALALGARDHVTKPLPPMALDRLDRFGTELLAKVRALLPATRPPAPRAATAPPSAWPTPPPALPRPPVELVALGASTGGPHALGEVLATLPAGFPAPVVVVQHLPPLFTLLFAERLDRRCALRVREARAGERLQAGDVWVASGDTHLRVVREADGLRLDVRAATPGGAGRTAVDVLLRSAAIACGGAALAAVLSGAGSDGLLGATALQAAGGEILVQDAATSAVSEMPEAIAEAGVAEAIVPLDAMGPEIWRRVVRRVGRAAGQVAATLPPRRQP